MEKVEDALFPATTRAAPRNRGRRGRNPRQSRAGCLAQPTGPHHQCLVTGPSSPSHLSPITTLLSELPGPAVAVDNRADAIGALDVVQFSAHGYTLDLAHICAVTIGPWVQRLAYHPFPSFAPIIQILSQSEALCAGAGAANNGSA